MISGMTNRSVITQGILSAYQQSIQTGQNGVKNHFVPPDRNSLPTEPENRIQHDSMRDPMDFDSNRTISESSDETQRQSTLEQAGTSVNKPLTDFDSGREGQVSESQLTPSLNKTGFAQTQRPSKEILTAYTAHQLDNNGTQNNSPALGQDLAEPRETGKGGLDITA
jgi:hypothetical protein